MTDAPTDAPGVPYPTHAASAPARAGIRRAAALALLLGASLVFVTGFVQVEAVHNAAHDTRHALSFPCH